ncbi:MAG: hypothetical protein ACM3X1_02950 [Ignavibacteriales bacterium]
MEAVKLINGKEKFQKYYKSERMAFEHFHFPEVFFRQKKKAYISFVDQEILDIARNAKYISCNDAAATAAVMIAAAAIVVITPALAIFFASRRFKQIRKDS